MLLTSSMALEPLLADRIPDARLVTFPELGHLLFWEDPAGFADTVSSFLLGWDGPGTDSRIFRDFGPLPGPPELIYDARARRAP